MRVLGLMSGTSMDGIDAALIETDGHRVLSHGAWSTHAYDLAFRARLRAVLGGVGDIGDVARELTEIHAEIVKSFLAAQGLTPSDLDLIGFHGHTILHRPEERRTWQIGDGARLAALTGIDVVCDFRIDDVAAGGQGAPLVPVYHRALAVDLEKPLAIVNIGGVANVTWIGSDDTMLAFDTGPGNALIDDWLMQYTGKVYDQDGALAGQGIVDQRLLSALMANRYFALRPPKSLDRDDFSIRQFAGLSTDDGAATLTAFTARSIAAGGQHLPAPPRRWLVTGGGRHNATLMRMLASELGVPVDPVEAVGWRGDALEAEAFAYLATRSRLGLPISFPGTTGVPVPLTGGRYFRA